MSVRAPRAPGRGRGALPLAALLVALAAAPAPAQVTTEPPAAAPSPKRGGGLWMDAGVGYGWLRLTCATCSGVVAAAGTAYTVTVGIAPAQNVLLGVQGQQWSSTGGAVAQRVRSIIAVAQWYPWAGMGFFLRAGTGIVQGPVAPSTGTQSATAQGTGVSFALGVGYDIKVTRHVGVALQAAHHVSALGDLTVGGQPAADVIAYVTRLGVAVVLR